MDLLTERLASRNFGPSYELRDIFFVPRLEIVFCAISKAASTFMKTYLYSLSVRKPFKKLSKNVHLPSVTGFQGAEQLGHEEMSSILLDTSIPKIILGRDPVDRLVSAYRNRVSRRKQEHFSRNNYIEWIALVQQIGGGAVGSHAMSELAALMRGVTWNELVQYVCETPSFELDRHLVPQTFFAATEEVRYDLVGTVEEMGQFMKRLHDLIELPPLVTGGSRLNESAESEIPEITVSSDQRRQLEKRYKADYEYFSLETRF